MECHWSSIRIKVCICHRISRIRCRTSRFWDEKVPMWRLVASLYIGYYFFFVSLFSLNVAFNVMFIDLIKFETVENRNGTICSSNVWHDHLRVCVCLNFSNWLWWYVLVSFSLFQLSISFKSISGTVIFENTVKFTQRTNAWDALCMVIFIYLICMVE